MNATLFIRQFKAEDSTKQSYGRQLKYIEAFLKDERLTLSQLRPEAYERFLSDKNWGNGAQRLNLNALGAYLRWEDEPHPMMEFKISHRQAGPQRFLREDQLEALLDACESCHKDMAVRNRAILLVLWDTLLRASEVCRIQLDHLDLTLKMLRVETKAAPGRGRSWESKIFSSRTSEAIKDWLAVRDHYSLAGDPHLFVSQAGGALTREGLRSVFKRLREHVDFNVSPHDLRRGGAAHAVQEGVPDRLVMQQGGWKNHSVFQRYTEGAKLTAYASLLWNE